MTDNSADTDQHMAWPTTKISKRGRKKDSAKDQKNSPASKKESTKVDQKKAIVKDSTSHAAVQPTAAPISVAAKSYADQLEEEERQQDIADYYWYQKRQAAQLEEQQRTEQVAAQQRQDLKKHASEVNELLRVTASTDDPAERQKHIANRRSASGAKPSKPTTSKESEAAAAEAVTEAKRINRLVGMASTKGVAEVARVRRILKGEEGIAVEELPEIEQRAAAEAAVERVGDQRPLGPLWTVRSKN